MALIKSGRQAIADAMNAYGNLGLTPNQLIYEKPTVIDPVGPNGENTKIKVIAAQSAAVRGATVVQYRRLPFSSLFTQPDGVNPLVIPGPFTANFSTDLIPNMKQFCGMDIEESDIEVTAINRAASTVELIAKEDSVGWLGSVTARLVDGDAILSNAFTTTDLTDFYAYPNRNTLLGQAALYSYRFDFSVYSAQLLQVTANNLPLAVLAGMLKTVTKNDWGVGRNPSDYNLNACVFRYNGLNNNPQYLGNTNYSRLLVLELAFYSLKLGGLLYIHYNA